ncbi:phosphonoacetaldehyde reductase [Paenibacillus sp. J5C_2022]|uniref:phosphonoacetaldehyde reductase n=1 Tax=Paenibacillus sp. J5C2022 TaxID=2977129 RepID=UPI0021D14BFF|nr:phosphonoacetaldehyde reductase [Paenibacillus sp. J5C2022]MCU6710184.1 phosphonoacetaldehyde reductase [Paenibacillus sp. J5C2022]
MERFYNPVETYFGTGAMEQLSAVIDSDGETVEKVLLITRGGDFSNTADYRKLMQQLQHTVVFVYPVEISNPDVTDLHALLQATRDFDYNLVIAVGGGSVLDLGKSAAGFKGYQCESADGLREAIVSRAYSSNSQACSWIALPTTAGTGSEVTPWATIWDRKNDVKYSVEGKNLFAKAAIIDPLLTLSLPVRTSIISGLDAICHATEAYWSRNTNEISRQFALQAIRSLVPNLASLREDPHNVEIRTQVALGSFLAGLAFSNTRTTACHSISYPITLLYGIEHGLAASMTLAKMMKWNEEALIDPEKLFRAFGAADVDGIGSVLDGIYEKSGFSGRLRDYAVPQEGLRMIVEKAYTKGRMDNNPRSIEQEELHELLLEVY